MPKRDAELEQKWRATIGAYEQSGQTIRGFCRDRGVKETAFHGWRRELRRRDGVEPPRQRKSKRSRFVQVQVAQVPLIEIMLARGATIRVPAHLDRAQLTEIFAAAQQAAAC